jgi:hypothetical protein
MNITDADKNKAIKLIKTTTSAIRYPNMRSKPSEPYFYILEFHGNTVLNMTKHRDGVETWYDNDTVSTTHRTIREAKRMVVDRILEGKHGVIMRDWLLQAMGKDKERSCNTCLSGELCVQRSYGLCAMYREKL